MTGSMEAKADWAELRAFLLRVCTFDITIEPPSREYRAAALARYLGCGSGCLVLAGNGVVSQVTSYGHVVLGGLSNGGFDFDGR